MVDSVPTTIVGMNESFNTSNVTTFMQAFSYHKFTFLDLTGIDTYGANETTALAQMFRGIELTDSNELDVSHFNINSNATNLSYMFASMVGVETIKFGEGFATSQATTLGYMFDGFQGRTLDLRYFKNSTNNSIKGMFNGCSNLTTIYVDSANWTDKNLSGNFAFSGCSNLVGCNEDGSVTSSWVSSHTAGTYARIPYLDESGNIKSGYFTDINAPILPGYMIDEATGTLHLSAGKEGYNPAPAIITGFDSSSDVPWLKTAAKLKYTKVVVDLDTNNQKLSPQSMAFWFLDASNITFIDLKNLNANQVTSMNSTFCGCSALTDLDLSSLDTSNVKNMSSTFAHTKSLGTLTLGDNFTTENVVDMSGLFLGDNEYVTQSSTPTKIVGMKDSFITNNVQTFSNAFRYHKFTSLDFSGFNTEAVPSDTESGIKGMFCGLYLTDSSILDISTFVVKPSSLIETFGKMVGVTSIVFGTDFDASSVTKMECAFMNFEGTTLDLTTFGSSKIAESSGLGSAFSGCSNLTTIYVDSAK